MTKTNQSTLTAENANNGAVYLISLIPPFQIFQKVTDYSFQLCTRWACRKLIKRLLSFLFD
ncbi:hypothetical protein [Psychrobacillus vulpis]|uniref:Uncharacterized protein n=1 Tax=Psychrobacillus vulpis TaxID=2325572 RepID=A0A544TNL7_9BACI|nr:hypothetical protein [Psychrobacillus vulpis]TQR19042.1 hypothetical protein FG384_14565 [Psychrobacillus vulpis]